MRRMFLLAGLLRYAPTLMAQDPFEIHIYEYEPLRGVNIGSRLT